MKYKLLLMQVGNVTPAHSYLLSDKLHSSCCLNPAVMKNTALLSSPELRDGTELEVNHVKRYAVLSPVASVQQMY